VSLARRLAALETGAGEADARLWNFLTHRLDEVARSYRLGMDSPAFLEWHETRPDLAALEMDFWAAHSELEAWLDRLTALTADAHPELPAGPVPHPPVCDRAALERVAEAFKAAARPAEAHPDWRACYGRGEVYTGVLGLLINSRAEARANFRRFRGV